ncbi:MAG: hypothetical protein IT460_04280 [Planctomycetes bacterium]|nr:hypothetical protein [Planctomycetota bacterium]
MTRPRPRTRVAARGATLVVLTLAPLRPARAMDAPAVPDAGVERPPEEDVRDAVEEPRWLGSHQERDGRFSAARWHRAARGEPLPEHVSATLPGVGRPEHDAAVTSLAVLAFVGAGWTASGTTTEDRTVAWARHFLRSEQRRDGAVGDPAGPAFATGHGLATWALAALAARSGRSDDAEAAERAFVYAVTARAEDERRWETDVGPGGVPPVAWLAMAADAAATRGPDGPGPSLAWANAPAAMRVRRDVEAWLDEAPTSWSLGRVGVALALRLRGAPERRTEATSAAAAAWIAARPPRWREDGVGVDVMGWAAGTWALFAVGGEPWRAWETTLRDAVVDRQRKDGTYCRLKGSWDPVGVWADEGGRVFSTAANALILEVWYRYDKVLGAAPERPSRAVPAPQPPPDGDRAPPPRRFAPCE